jgi:hypothetical protein
MGGTALIPVCFHATTMVGEVRERLIDKKCGGFVKINTAKSADKERFRRVNADKSSRNVLLTSSESLIFFLLLCPVLR